MVFPDERLVDVAKVKQGRAQRRELAQRVAERRVASQRLYSEGERVLAAPARTIAERQEVLSRTQQARRERAAQRHGTAGAGQVSEAPGTRELRERQAAAFDEAFAGVPDEPLVVRSDDELTAEQRERIESALREVWTDWTTGRMSPEFDAALREGYLVLACRWTFDNTDAPALAELLDGMGVLVHREPEEEGWLEFAHTYGMDCPHCGSRLYAEPNTFREGPADAEWPGDCFSCGKAVAPPHHTAVGESSDGAFFAYCSCKWLQEGWAKTRPAAKGVGTRHRNAEEAKRSAAVAA